MAFNSFLEVKRYTLLILLMGTVVSFNFETKSNHTFVSCLFPPHFVSRIVCTQQNDCQKRVLRTTSF